MPEFTASDGLVVHFEVAGEEDSPPVVLLHDAETDLRMWMPHIGAFSADYRVILPDLRGHGLSGAPESPDDYRIGRFAADLGELLDSLNLDICALVGAGFGGMVALEFAVAHAGRVAALVLSDTAAAPDHPDYDVRFREWEAARGLAAATAERFGMAGLGRRAAKDVRDEFLREQARTRYDRMSLAGYLGAARAWHDRPDLLPMLRERLTMPVLLTAGSDGPYASSTELIHTELPAARFLLFRGAGRSVPVQRPEHWGEAVLAFLADVEEGRPVAGRKTL